MELINIESSRIIFLTQVHRPSGQLFLPEAFEKLKNRYSFSVIPKPDDPAKDGYAFLIGKYDNSQIQEMKIYSDGIIVTSRSNMEILDGFIDDLFRWTKTELGLVQTSVAKPEKHYESCMVVRSKTDLAKVLQPNKHLQDIFATHLDAKVFGNAHYVMEGLLASSDPAEVKGLRKPMRFSVERLAKAKFSENVFYTWAPLTTNDHLALLGALEDLAPN